MRRLWSQHRVGISLIFWLWPLTLFAAPKPKDVVANVDGHSITVEDVQKKLPGLRVARPEAKPEDLKREALNELIIERLVKIKAQSIPLEQDSAFMRRADYLLDQIAAREIFNRVVVEACPVTDEEIVGRYQKNPEQYKEAAWVHAAHILITPVKDTLLLTTRQRETGWWPKTNEEARDIADSLCRLIFAGHSFDSLARIWSQDMASGINGGDLDFFPPGQMVPEFDSVVFGVPVGEVSPPVKTQFGYHLIKVFSRQKERPRPLSDSLKNAIRQQILSEKVIVRTRVFLDSLYLSAELAYNEEAFERTDSALQAQRIWVATSRFGDTVWSDKFAAQLAIARPIAPGGNVDRDYKAGILKELMNPLLIRRAVRDLKIDESELCRSQKEQIYQNERLARVWQDATLEYNPTEDEVREYYRLYQRDFLPSDSFSVHVLQMVFKTKMEAERVLREMEAGADFSLLARKYFPGDSDIAQEAFDLGFISSAAMPEEFFAVAETLTVGAFSRPVKTQWGYHLLRVLARRPDLSLEAARPRVVVAIRKAKQEEHRRKWEDSLRQGHVISIKERVLKSIKYDPASGGISGKP
ncbi:MAG: peptidylprolyl isomerase [Candidatus Zixiibacteriota bacterium]